MNCRNIPCTCEITPQHLCPLHCMSAEQSGRISYVGGFLFSPTGLYVALIKKNQPEWQRGKLNAIGGKIEPGETPEAAMRREFKEEAGLDIPDWRQFCRLAGTEYQVFFFEASSERFAEIESLTKEKVQIYLTDEIPILNTIPNLEWLVPLARDRNKLTGVIRERADATAKD